MLPLPRSVTLEPVPGLAVAGAGMVPNRRWRWRSFVGRSDTVAAAMTSIVSPLPLTVTMRPCELTLSPAGDGAESPLAIAASRSTQRRCRRRCASTVLPLRRPSPTHWCWAYATFGADGRLGKSVADGDRVIRRGDGRRAALRDRVAGAIDDRLRVADRDRVIDGIDRTVVAADRRLNRYRTQVVVRAEDRSGNTCADVDDANSAVTLVPLPLSVIVSSPSVMTAVGSAPSAMASYSALMIAGPVTATPRYRQDIYHCRCRWPR